MDKSILWFKAISQDDAGIAGEKGAKLGEMTKAGFPVPNGFVVTSFAYFHFLRQNKLIPKITSLLTTVNYEQPDSLLQVSGHIKKLILSAEVSEELIKKLDAAYHVLGGVLQNTFVAIKSSATTEDLPTASFAGQQETFLSVSGEANLIIKVKECWASLFTSRAIFYRHKQKFDHFGGGIAVVVQKMIDSEQSGVMLTIDPVTNEKSKIVIEAVAGLGELVVQGKVTPDHYEVAKDTLTILTKTVAYQEQMLQSIDGKKRELALAEKERNKQKISDKHILELATLGKKLEKYFLFPQEVAWAIEQDKIYIVQTRPITTISTQTPDPMSPLSQNLKLLLKGTPTSAGIASGPIKIIKNITDLSHVFSGDIMVTSQTTPEYIPAMKKASGILTDTGGRTSHAALIARELGIPAIVGLEKATQMLKTGTVVTINGSKGEIYHGATIPTTNHEPKHCNIKTATKIYVNLAQASVAETIAKEACADGIGLLRAEFMISSIGSHPMKCIKDDKQQQFINQLADQIALFCKAFYPRPVVYRTSDFQTNEYADLKGGKEFEPIEPNPQMGFRGTFRYMHNPEVFKLELEAIKKVREKMGLTNVWMMLPFVRTVNELIHVKQMITSAGLHRGPQFKLWMMIEIPSNVILLEEYIKAGIDGVSIGSNDLTMLLLGTDHTNSEVAPAYDELDPSVLWALEHVIKTAHKHGITTSICGQAPSSHPSLIEKLINWGITSISVAPDALDKTRAYAAEAERKLIEKRHHT